MEKEEVVAAFDKKPSEQQIVATKKAEAEEIIEAFRDFEIEDDDDYAVVADGLKEVKTIAKDLEERRKKITQPINGALREFNSWFKPAQVILENTERLLKDRMDQYLREKEEKSRLAMATVLQASQEGDFDTAHEAAKGIVESPIAAGISHSRYYDYEVVDLSVVPREHLCLDHSSIKMHIKSAGRAKPSDVPGIRFFEKTRTSVRT